MSYRLAQPRFLKAGTRLQAVAWYDNSEDNPHNPDPNKSVTWGGQTYEEMMVGFFDVAGPCECGQRTILRAAQRAGEVSSTQFEFRETRILDVD